MTFTYDVSTSRGQVRLLVPDAQSASYVFEDAEIDAFLTLEGNIVRLAAALALETLASSEAYTQKVIKTLDLLTNGAQTAKALTDRAALLRQQYLDDSGSFSGLFDWAEEVLTDAQARERLIDQALRRNL